MQNKYFPIKNTFAERGSTKCQKCHHENLRKVKQRPAYGKLINDITFLGGYAATGRKYGVSDNTIRKWLKFYEKQM